MAKKTDDGDVVLLREQNSRLSTLVEGLQKQNSALTHENTQLKNEVAAMQPKTLQDYRATIDLKNNEIVELKAKLRAAKAK